MPGSTLPSWKRNAASICRNITKQRSVLKIVLKTRNEIFFLDRWIKHHANIVGPRNLIILDNESDDPKVLDILTQAASKSTVFSFSGVHNRMHSLNKFGKLYNAVRSSSDYMIVLDTDEFLVWTTPDGNYLEGPDILDALKCIKTSEPILGVWANNVRGLDDRFTLYNKKSEQPIGLAKGKSIIPSTMPLKGRVCHNYHFDAINTDNVIAGNALILHMKNLSVDQRIRVNIEKLRHYAVIGKSEGIEAVLAIDLANYPRGNGREYITEIQNLSAGESFIPIERDAPLVEGQFRLSSGKMSFATLGDRLRYMNFIRAPGKSLERALAEAKTNPASLWTRLATKSTISHDSSALDDADVIPTNQKDRVMSAIDVPERPHMPSEAANFLDECLKISKCYLEYGSGGSTRLAASYSVPYIYSVESDASFAEAVKTYVNRDNDGIKLNLIIPDIGKTENWGFPVDNASAVSWPAYPAQIWDIIAKDQTSPDLILIDGRFRVACFLYCLLASKPGTTIIFDDYRGRKERYSGVEAHVQPEKMVGRTAVFKVPEMLDVRAVAFSLLKYAMDPR